MGWPQIHPWNADARTFDIHKGAPPAGGEVLLRRVCALPLTFQKGFAGSRGSASVTSDADSTFSIRKNGVEIGTATFAAGATVATFALAADARLEPGDVITIVAPNAPDAHLSDFCLSLLHNLA
jgi:hypothetical protein